MAVSGEVNWVLFIDAAHRAGGYKAWCDASSGSVTISDANGRLATITNNPVTQSHKADGDSNETYQCDVKFTVHLPRRAQYVLAWTDPDMPRSNPGCDNSKPQYPSESIRVAPSDPSATFPEYSFTYLCT